MEQHLALKDHWTDSSTVRDKFELPCLILSSINFIILSSVLACLAYKKHLFQFKTRETVTLLSFFASSLLRFISWLYVYMTDEENRNHEEFYLQLLDDLASLIAWAVLMYFVFSMHELKIILDSDSS